MDDKAQAAVWVANLLCYKRERFRPDRDLILALTTDEERGGPYNCSDWLLENKSELIDERMPVQSFYEGQTFLYEPVKKLSSGSTE